MLVLSRKPGEKIIVNGSITITLVRIKWDRVAIGIEAPKSVEVHRAEVAQKDNDMNDDNDELWDEDDSETIRSTCESCGEITLVQLLEDPFVSERILEPSENPSDDSGYWCKKCFQNRKNDV